MKLWPTITVVVVTVFGLPVYPLPAQSPTEIETLCRSAAVRGDWPQWGGTSARNSAPAGRNTPIHWDVGSGENIKWSASLGTETNGTPVVAGGRVFIGTNNGAGYLTRYPSGFDLGCLLCFDEATGRFLWQFSAEKLPTGQPHDWPEMGICSTPLIDGDRLWLVSNRGELVCLDARGFRDGQNDGPFRREPVVAADEADIVWSLDFMGELGVQQHNVANCSVTAAGEVLLVNTSNGVDKSHNNIPRPQAPSFLAVDKQTGQILWADASPGENILHGQWSSPAFALLGGVPQAIFAGGDGWVYSFEVHGDGDGHSKLLWKCDANPKAARWINRGAGTRNNIIATPVIDDGLVYVATGQSPDYGNGLGRLICIDPTRDLNGADVSSELAIAADGFALPQRRIQAINIEAGERAIVNPNSAIAWDFVGRDCNGDGKLAFDESLHRTLSSVAVKDRLLILPDLAGVVHCLDARTGNFHWSCDLMEEVWASPLIVEDKLYVATVSGTVALFRLHANPDVAMNEGGPISRIEMGQPIHATPIVADNVLYIATRRQLYAIEAPAAGKAVAK